MYKYSLEPYRFSKSKHNCPQCRRPSFTRYIEVATGQYLADDVGRCDHINSCGYHKPPKEYFEENRKSAGFKINESAYKVSIGDAANGTKRMPTAYEHEVKQTHYINYMYVQKLHKGTSNFVKWLLLFFNNDKQKVKEAYDKYMLGAINRKVIFWQIDKEGNVHDGKIMEYDSATGHRRGQPSWVCSNLRNDNKLPADFKSVKCFFGEHLLKKDPNAIVYLVESEKTAVFCSIRYPQFIWIATGGCQALNTRVLKVLEGRRVVVCPDSGAYNHWHEILEQNQNIKYSFISLEDKEPNTDIADLLIEEVTNQRVRPFD